VWELIIDNMSNTTVALTQCSSYGKSEIAEAIEKQFALLGGLEKFITRGDSVLLKPNFIAPRSHRHATQTDPAVIIETARLLKDFGAKPFVGDSPAWSNVFACAKALRLVEPLKQLSVPIKQLNKPKKSIIGAKNTKIMISSVALEADAIINLPKFKAHQQLIATFAIKNMFGCVSGKRKALLHFAKGNNPDNFCEMLIDIFEFLNPVMTIIDAVTAMDGPGPIRGNPRPLGYLIGGTDPIACETICAKLIGMESLSLPIIKTAEQMNYGCCDINKIKIMGDSFPTDIFTDFQIPKQIPIRFSFLHVCKSIYKQILLLIKEEFRKNS
jgi:uncharacterized protein (DUF362 family)